MNRQPWITLEDVEALVGALEAAEYQDDKAKRTLLIQFTRDRLREDEPGAGFTPDRLDNGHYDLLSIVRQAADQRGAIRAMADAVHAMAPDDPKAKHFIALCRGVAEREPTILNLDEDRRTLRRAIDDIFLTQPLAALYARAMPTRRTTAKKTLWAAVLELASLGSELPLFRFLELAAAAADDGEAADALRKWSDERQPRLANADVWQAVLALREELKVRKPEPTTTPGLMVRLDGDGDAWSVTAWIWAGTGMPGPNIGPGEVTWAELEVWLSQVLAEHAEGLLKPDAEPTPLIEFVLPARQLSDTVEALTVTLGGHPERLGVRHQVSVRPDDRSPEGMDLLRQRWPIAVRVLDSADELADASAWWVSSTVDSTMQSQSGQAADWAWLAVTCPRIAAADQSAHVTLLDTGTPIAVWVRGQRDATERLDAIAKTTADRQLGQLPTAVQRRRKGGFKTTAADARRDLVLLWDDPTRPPPPRAPLAAPRT